MVIRQSPEARVLGRYVVVDPRICHGEPTFRGTRIFVRDVLDEVARGLAWDTVVEMWGGDVSKDAIAEALRLARDAFLEKERLAIEE